MSMVADDVGSDGDDDGDGIDGDDACAFVARSPFCSHRCSVAPVARVRSVGAPEHVGQRREPDMLSASLVLVALLALLALFWFKNKEAQTRAHIQTHTHTHTRTHTHAHTHTHKTNTSHTT